VRARTRRWAALAIATTIASLALPASAATILDPSMARGPLDLKRLTATKHDAGAPLHVTIVTWEAWPANTLALSGQNRIFVHFNTNHRGGYEYVGEIRFNEGELVMRIEDRDGHFVRGVPVSHPTGDMVRMTIPAGLPNPNGHSWIAAAEHWVTETGFCAQVCDDRIPGQGWLKVTPGQ
jgi:hypothetical protein